MRCNDWREVRLGEIIEFNPKESISKGTLAKKISMDMINPFYKFVKEYEIEEYKGGSKFRNGDTLMARITPCLENGKTAKVTILNKKEIGFGSTEFIVLRAKEGETTEDFVYYIAISPYVRDIAIKSMTGTSGRQRAQVNVIQNIQIYLPPLNEQKAIAKILSDLDEKIEINNRINKVLEEIAQAIFKRWFMDFEFPNENGEPYKSSGGEMVESELGLIPKEWMVGKLGDVLETIETGNRPKGGAANIKFGIPSIGAENIIGLGKYDYSKEKYVPVDYFKKMKKGIVYSEDVLLYKDGAQLGRKTLFMDGFPYEECCVNSHVFILRCNDLISQIYLYFWLDQGCVTDKIIQLNANSAQPGINQAQLKTLDIIIPSKDIITNFTKLIKQLLRYLFNNCKENNKLSQLRDTLLPKLMSGEIRVDLNNDQISV